MPTSADSKNKRVVNSSPATNQTLRQQGGTEEDSLIHLADWTFSVAGIEKKGGTAGIEKKRGRCSRNREEGDVAGLEKKKEM